MKCPKCGAQIAAGRLYCEVCGEEIRIVPDFDPQLDDSLQETLGQVARELLPPKQENQNMETDLPKSGEGQAEEDPFNRHKRSRKIWLGSVSAMAAGTILLFLALGFYMNRSPEFQVQRALHYMEQENYVAAQKFLKRAVELEPEKVEYQLRLAECCAYLGQADAARDGYLHCLELDHSNIEAYQHLVAYYEGLQDYEAINALFEDCEDETVLNTFKGYLANPPEFSLKEGTYQQVQALKLLSNAPGNIYYTMDGTEPDLNSQIYQSPIFLENGTYVINAVFVNAYGVVSDKAVGVYRIDAATPLAPDVDVYSGIYTEPVQIKVAEQSGCVVHYTTDGSTPNQDSPIYYGPIDMPLGASIFQFVAYSQEGVPGEITTRNYELQLVTNLSVTEAQNGLLQQLISAGVLEVDAGVSDMEGRNTYDYTAVIAIAGGNYYFFTEYYEDAGALRNKTGNFYAVDVMNGQAFQALPNDAGSYDLQPI